MEAILSTSNPDFYRVKMSQQNENIQVYVRVRPMNSLEKNKNSLQVLDCPGNREVVVRERTANNLTKTFTFDRVFSPSSKQIDVYKVVVAPLLEEVLLGYNCTVFAYGQTGTGKTFTMEGERSVNENLTWENDPLTGIVPRALSQLFDELRLQNVEFTVRVSLLELYNEELFDLLGPTDDLKPKQLRLFEDSTRRGSVIIQGLEEVTVHNKHEVYHIMERGNEKRKTAATQMNATSSRSHTVFTVTIHIKESNIDGEELIKIGKLHLVDLAGSENIGRSGAVDKRAREAGSINQSLLTLGRVITALVERAPHVPYRESKLTRLLQDSLGGRTKTSIIATVSPASYNLEETLSTLDYAHRAKNIMNRPEINQKLTKKAVMKEFTEEIERLRRDLVATREKNGVFLDKENYERMTAQIESQGQDLCEKITQTRALQETLDKKEEEMQLLKGQLEETQEDLNLANQVLAETRGKVDTLQQQLVQTKLERDQQEHLVETHVKTEENLSKEAEILLQTTEETTSNLDKLYRKLDRKKHVEQSNMESGRRFKNELLEQFHEMCESLRYYRSDQIGFFGIQRMNLEGFLEEKETQMTAMINLLANLMEEVQECMRSLDAFVKKEEDAGQLRVYDLRCDFLEHKEETIIEIDKSKNCINSCFETLQGRIELVNQKLESLAKDYEREMEEHTSTVDKFVTESIKKIEDTRNDIENHLDDKLTRYVSLQSEIMEHRELNDQYVKKFKADAKNMIEEMGKWIEYASEFEKKSGKKSEDLLDSCDQSDQKEKEFLRRMTNVYDIHRIEADLLRTNFNTVKVKKQETQSQNVKKLTETIEQAANTSKFLRGASLEGLNMQLVLLEKGSGLVTKRLDKHARKQFDFTEKFFADSQAVAENIDKGLESVLAGVEKSYNLDSDYAGDGMRKMEAQCNKFAQWSRDTEAKVNQQSGKVGEFWESTYLVDLPSGVTPQKKAYQYPRNLSATSPHETILERFTTKRREEEKNEIF